MLIDTCIGSPYHHAQPPSEEEVGGMKSLIGSVSSVDANTWPVVEVGANTTGSTALSFTRAQKSVAVIIGLLPTIAFADRLFCEMPFRGIGFELPVEAFVLENNKTDEALSVDQAQRSVDALMAAVAAEPIEDGVSHSAEAALADHVARYGDACLVSHMKSVDRMSTAASLLRLLGRCSKIDANVQLDAVKWGLASSSAELRDSAIQAAEGWGNRALAPVLRNHEDSIGWISEYAQRVARDIEG